jgi:hypothetical protein
MIVVRPVDRAFGEKFLTSVDDFYGYGVHLLFNDWWESAPADVIEKYVAALEADSAVAELAHEQWYAEPLSLESLKDYAPGTLGHAYRDFMVSNDLMERLAEGYRDLHEQFATDGKLDRMPPLLKYKVLRGYQSHDLHHVLTGYPATPFGELALQGISAGADRLSVLRNVDCCCDRTYGVRGPADDQAGDGCNCARLDLRPGITKHPVRKVRGKARSAA